MTDNFTVTTRKGFGSRVASSFAGLVVGPILIIAAIVLLWWNEGRAVQAIVGLDDASRQVVEAEAAGPAAGNANKLVHVVGPATAQDPIEDTDVDITFVGQVAVARTAEMYQWDEKKKETTQRNMDGSETTITEYSYAREWSDDAIDSSKFVHPDGHQNLAMPFRNARWSASDARLGDWRLDSDTLARVNLSERLKPDAPAGWILNGDSYYGGDPAAPQIGDMRVRYVGLPSGTTISVLALQSGDGFAAFTAKNGYGLFLAMVGDHSAEEMIARQRKTEGLLTWILRGVGTVLMFAGFASFLAPLSTMTSIVPIVGFLVRGAVSLVAFALAIPLSLTVIALAWLVYRPLVAGALILVAAGTGFVLWRWRERHAPQVPPAVPAG